MKIPSALIFPPFLASDWTEQSDSLRGGISTSALTINPHSHSATFSGNFNSSILGAGFASQRTTGVRDWDWSAYSGVELIYKTPEDCSLSDRVFSIVLKNALTTGDEAPNTPTPGLPEGPNSVSFEFDFEPECSHRVQKVRATWEEFYGDYRGEVVDEKLDPSNVSRFIVMVRSFFGKEGQDGDFELELLGVKAWGKKRKDKGEWKGEW